MKKNKIIALLAVFFIGSYLIISCRHEPPYNGCSFTYSAWSACDSTGHETRTYASDPAGCIGTPPTDSITRFCGTTACSFSYGAWTACSNGTQTRTYTSSPTGCSGTPPTDSLTRTCSSNCPTINVTGTPTHPTNGANGSISVSATGGVSPYSYSIDGGAYITTSNFTSLSSGAHTISAKDVNGCTSSTVSVTLNCPTVSVTGTSKSPNYNCSNGSITLTTATGGVAPYTYNNNGGTFASSTTFSNLGTGTYTIIAKDAKGCQGTTQLSVTAPSTVSFAASIKPTINSNCGRANVGCHNHTNAWTSFSDIVGTSTGTSWSSNLLTFIQRVRGTSGTTGSCSVMYSSGRHDMPPSSSTAWTTFIQGTFTNWVNQGYPNN